MLDKHEVPGSIPGQHTRFAAAVARPEAESMLEVQPPPAPNKSVLLGDGRDPEMILRGLIYLAQISVKPVHRLRQDVDLIRDSLRGMSLVGVHDELRRHAERLHRVPKLERLRRRHFLVALALKNQHRRLRLLDKRYR